MATYAYSLGNLAIVLLLVMAQPGVAADKYEFFESRIRPILVKHCYECHSAASAELKGNLQLDFRAGIRKGGESGAAVVPGAAKKSLLLDALRYESFQMPPKGKLPDNVIRDFELWINNGADDPRDIPPTSQAAAEATWKAILAERRKWWSLQPLRKVGPPSREELLRKASRSNNTRQPSQTDKASIRAWLREPIDRFVLARLLDEGLEPSPTVDGVTLRRRLAFVLTGLPLDVPNAREVAPSFVVSYRKDPDKAIEELVDGLLASPHFGERFARHWMDVVRYTDTYGYEWDNPAKGSWEYRDYLIRAFNEDIGFDQLVREQIAGDLIKPRISQSGQSNESIIGPMFFHMGEHRHGSSLEFNGVHQEMVNNKIDAFSKAFLAMTVGCARCHDHKLDAISQRDYYALAGVIMSPRWTARVIDLPSKHASAISKLKQLRSQIQKLLAQQWSAVVTSIDGTGKGNNTSESNLADRSTAHSSALATDESFRKWVVSQSQQWKSAKLGDIQYPLAKLVTATDENVASIWQQLASEWFKTHAEHKAWNAGHFRVVSNMESAKLPEGWVGEGDGYTHGFVDDATIRVSLEGDSIIDEFLPQGVHTHALSSKLPGIIRSPSLKKFPAGWISLQLRGGEWAGTLRIPQNAFLAETVKFLSPQTTQWINQPDSSIKHGVTRIMIEVATSSLNTNFPPRTGLARAGSVKLPDNDEAHFKRSWFSLTQIVTHQAPHSPKDPLLEFQPLFGIDVSPVATPTSTKQAWRLLRNWFSGAVERWTRGKSTAGDVKLLNWLLSSGLLPQQLKRDTSQVSLSATEQELKSLVDEYREVEASISYPRTVISMDEQQLEPLNYRLNVRGNVDVEGDAIPRDFLSVYSDQQEISTSAQIGRLELAEYLVKKNPQTARVYVNRVWQWVFGQGLVRTPNDFGKLGDKPSHPELLDWLAQKFMDEGWSTKKLVRRLVLSQAFRQAGRVSPRAKALDPENRWLHHFSTRRLDAEAIRDSLLAVSGRLDRKLYGLPINPYRTAEDSSKRLFSGPLDSHGRRSIYIKMSIMEPPKFLKCFNLPDLKLPTGRREITNDPAQALAMLNHPLVVKMSEHWAQQILAADTASPQDASRIVGSRIKKMFNQAFGRNPSPNELNRWSNAVRSFSSSKDILQDKAAWTELAHALFNTKEFIYIR